MHDLLIVAALQLGMLLLLNRLMPGRAGEQQVEKRLLPVGFQPSFEGARRMIEREYESSVCQGDDAEDP
jgi:hypothetical protein